MQKGSSFFFCQHVSTCLSIYLNIKKYTFQTLVPDESEAVKGPAVWSAGPGGESAVAQWHVPVPEQESNAYNPGVQTLQNLKGK